MKVRIFVSPSARRQGQDAATWWKANRRSAPKLFREELTETLARLRAAPLMGARCDAIAEGARQVLMRRTHYYLVYQYDAATGELEVLAVWSNHRGEDPPISGRT